MAGKSRLGPRQLHEPLKPTNCTASELLAPRHCVTGTQNGAPTHPRKEGLGGPETSRLGPRRDITRHNPITCETM